MKIKTFFISLGLLALTLALTLAPQGAFAGVKIGASTMTMPPSTKPQLPQDTQTIAEATGQKPLPTAKASPLARSVAELFRKDVEELKTVLIERSLVNVPPAEKATYRRQLDRELQTNKVLNLYGLTLEKYYTEDELKALRTFMGDDTNRAMLEKLPTVLSQMGFDRQQYLNQVLENFLKRELFDKLEKGDATILTPRK